ncbi:MAG: hypothetical protein JSS83_24875 [Cyanobacteria bacterium SZAS LIN-3]|nr:hypothetical protein [Cyanobacteria bacterium SZAS LIN-3]
MQIKSPQAPKLLQIGLLALLAIGQSGLCSAAGAVSHEAASRGPAGAAAHPAPADDAAPEAPKRNFNAPVLGTLAKEYKDAPDDVSWNKYFTYLRDMLVNGDFASANAADIIAANPSLTDLHVRITDAGAKNAHVWSFPSISESHAVIFVAPGKTTAIPLPLSIVLREARVIPSSFAAPAPRVEVTKIVKGHGKKAVVVRTARVVHAAAPAAPAAGGKYLVLIGGDRQNNSLWFKGLKIGEGPLVDAPELFASLPMFFSQNVSGKASFSGSDIVLTIQPPASNTPARDLEEKPQVLIQSNGKPLPVKPAAAAVAGYKVVLKYMGGKFALSGHMPDDAPLSVALAFCQNICAGRSDVAKAWLIDPKLVSIPKYLGLVGRTTPPMRLVAMSGASGSRYRLITSAKDDLIIDVGRITAPGRLKGQLAIKGLFIAPPDAYAAKLTGTFVMPQASEKPAADSDAAAAATKSGAKAPQAH